MFSLDCKFSVYTTTLYSCIISINKNHVINIIYFCFVLATSSKDDLHRRIGGRCSTNNMKVVFKVCCSTNEQHHNTSTIHSNSQSNVGGQQQSSGVSINTNIEQNGRVHTSGTSGSASSSSGSRFIPPASQQQNHQNNSNVVQSTMSWPAWSHPHSTSVTTPLSIQQFHAHTTSPRPNINSAINNHNNNNNSNYSPSHKPTKKTSKLLLIIFVYFYICIILDMQLCTS